MEEPSLANPSTQKKEEENLKIRHQLQIRNLQN